ncbi:unnamed protein product [Caenorhabditis angaria]|uniref:Uncharacterized protein n=1 Tax=Caenorhabditis angaria TaxID=860376 RepID=A0A9P1I448_9PELO|nr:unnamed protein product [Caenorhabditis angaria]
MEDEEADERCSTWNFIEKRESNNFRQSNNNSYYHNQQLHSPIGIGKTRGNGLETTATFRQLQDNVPLSPSLTTSTYQFHYVTRRLAGSSYTTVELDHTEKPLPEPAIQKEQRNTQMVQNGSSSYHRSSDTYIRSYSSTTSSSNQNNQVISKRISPTQRLSQYSLHSIIAVMSSVLVWD